MPDLGVTITEMRLAEVSDIVGSLHRGDHVRFNATMHAMGDTQHLHHLNLWGIEKISGHKDVEAYAKSNLRYKVRIEPHNHDHHDDHHEETGDHHSIVIHHGEEDGKP